MDEKYFDIVWRYYELHAKQRIENFRIYLVLITASFSLLGYFYKNAQFPGIYIYFPCFVYMFCSIIFLLLDIRTVTLIDKALYSLKNYENFLKSEKGDNEKIKEYMFELFNSHYKDKDSLKPKYREIFLIFYLINILLSVALIVLTKFYF
jgi:hypothetical protein